MERRRFAPWVAVVGLLAPVMMVSSVSFGLRAPAHGTLAPLPSEAALDYALRRNSFAPLTDRFVGGLGAGRLTAGAATPSSGSPLHRSRPAPILVEHPFTNDDVSQAYVIPSVPFTAKTNTASASRETGESRECAPLGGSAWYRFTPRKDLRLIASTIGTEYATALAVFSGPERELVGCARDPQGNALHVFRALEGVTYDFQITGPVNGGPLVFTLLADGATTRASVGPSEEEGSATSQYSVISSNGRFVAFSSYSNFTGEPAVSPPGDWCWMAHTAPMPDPACPAFLYLRDRARHTTEFIGRNLGNQVISRNSRYVVFVGAGPNGASVFRHDRRTRITREVSVSSSGERANQPAGGLVSVSADGRYVAFESAADNLVLNDENGVSDVFVRDMVTRTTTRVSVSSTAREGNAATSARFCSDTACEIGSHLLSISTTGRWIVFRSASSNLVPSDTNRAVDVFVHDRVEGITERVSVSSTGEEADGDTLWAHQGSVLTVSDDGRFVVFNSFATNLAPRDTNGVSDVFVRDRTERTTRLVSISSDGEQAATGRGPLSGGTYYMDWVGFGISPDGRFATFDSIAENLVDGDTNEQMDVFVRDLEAGVTVRMSVSSTGEQSAGYSYAPSISGNGRFVHFISDGDDLVGDDTNDVNDVFIHEIAAPGRALSDWY